MTLTKTSIAAACTCLISWGAFAQSACTFGLDHVDDRGAAIATPYCLELSKLDALGKKYPRLAPLYSSRETGWIFGNDQLAENYEPKAVAMDLLSAIVGEFKRRDIALAVMIAPPRPVVAGRAIIERTLIPAGSFDITAARTSFNRMIDAARSAGAIAPNLLEKALADEGVQEGFYFRRDTHWTPFGAAVSAHALAEALHAARPDLIVAVPNFAPAVLDPAGVVERGSLAEPIREFCGVDIEPEVAAIFDFGEGQALGLLDSPPETGRLALLGTSFSHRYGRDEYRVADALAAATGMEVDNYSISGGGPIGSIESYVLTGEINAGRHAVVVWELPYTNAFKSISALRQLLGALQARRATTEVTTQQLSESGTTVIYLRPGAGGALVVSIDTGNDGPQLVRGTIRFDNGSESRFTLSRSKRVPVDRRSREIYLSLSAFPGREPIEIAISHETDQTVCPRVTVHLVK